MAENKTKPTEANIEDYLALRAGAQQRADCRELMALLRKVTRKPPRMWGPSMVGYGSHRMGKSCLYFRQLADLDKAVLEQLVAGSVGDVMRRYG